MVKVSEILDHEGNPRIHPTAQKKAVQALLEKFGIVQSLGCYYSEMYQGQLTLFNGHCRKNISSPDQEWPADITDLTDQEVSQLLLPLDIASQMAELDPKKWDLLMGRDEVADFLTGTPDLAGLMEVAKAEAGIIDIIGVDPDDYGESDHMDMFGRAPGHDGKGALKTFTFGELNVMLSVDLYYQVLGFTQAGLHNSSREAIEELLTLGLTATLGLYNRTEKWGRNESKKVP
jgi:hypothetical protein